MCSKAKEATRMQKLKNWLKKHYAPYMLRPMLYRITTNVLAALAAVAVWHRFISPQQKIQHLIFAAAVIFAAMAWFNYLAADGVKMPFTGRKKNEANGTKASGMAEHINDEPDSSSSLGAEERIVCSLTSNILCCILFLAISLI